MYPPSAQTMTNWQIKRSQILLPLPRSKIGTANDFFNENKIDQ